MSFRCPPRALPKHVTDTGSSNAATQTKSERQRDTDPQPPAHTRPVDVDAPATMASVVRNRACPAARCSSRYTATTMNSPRQAPGRPGRTSGRRTTAPRHLRVSHDARFPHSPEFGEAVGITDPGHLAGDAETGAVAISKPRLGPRTSPPIRLAVTSTTVDHQHRRAPGCASAAERTAATPPHRAETDGRRGLRIVRITIARCTGLPRYSASACLVLPVYFILSRHTIASGTGRRPVQNPIHQAPPPVPDRTGVNSDRAREQQSGRA